jgi:hypothetical protein
MVVRDDVELRDEDGALYRPPKAAFLCRKDQCCARQGRRRVPERRGDELAVAACRVRVQRQMHDVDDQEGDAEQDAVTPECVGDGECGDEHCAHRE